MTHKTPYRDKEVEDVEYKTPRKPWHKSTAWFICAILNVFIAWLMWNAVAYYSGRNGMIVGNAVALGIATTIAALVTGAIAGEKKWGSQ
jgi:UDP-N-acetylmuramyl pentapeptide phosphotransferase/UDP-N-acetylglucosamine-1-phosphate transferase